MLEVREYILILVLMTLSFFIGYIYGYRRGIHKAIQIIVDIINDKLSKLNHIIINSFTDYKPEVLENYSEIHKTLSSLIVEIKQRFQDNDKS